MWEATDADLGHRQHERRHGAQVQPPTTWAAAHHNRRQSKYAGAYAVQRIVRRRTLAGLSFVVAIFACDKDRPPAGSPAQTGELRCRNSLKPEELLPGNATFVAYYDMNRERRHAPRISTKPGRGPRNLLPVEVEAVRMAWIGISAACELDDKFFGEAWLAVDPEEEGVVVLSGKGIGKEKNLRCISERLGAIDPSFIDGTSVRSTGCGLEIDGEYDEVSGFAPSDDILVLGTDPAVDRARAVWNGGFPNPPTRLLPPKRSKAWLWGALDVEAFLSPGEVASVFAGSGHSELGVLSTIKVARFQAAMTGRLSLEVGASFPSEADVRAARAVLEAAIASPPPALPAWAQSLISKTRVETHGPQVTVSMPLDRRTAYEQGLIPNHTEANQMPAFAWLSAIIVL